MKKIIYKIVSVPFLIIFCIFLAVYSVDCGELISNTFNWDSNIVFSIMLPFYMVIGSIIPTIVMYRAWDKEKFQ